MGTNERLDDLQQAILQDQDSSFATLAEMIGRIDNRVARVEQNTTALTRVCSELLRLLTGGHTGEDHTAGSGASALFASHDGSSGSNNESSPADDALIIEAALRNSALLQSPLRTVMSDELSPAAQCNVTSLVQSQGPDSFEDVEDPFRNTTEEHDEIWPSWSTPPSPSLAQNQDSAQIRTTPSPQFWRDQSPAGITGGDPLTEENLQQERLLWLSPNTESLGLSTDGPPSSVSEAAEPGPRLEQRTDGTELTVTHEMDADQGDPASPLASLGDEEEEEEEQIVKPFGWRPKKRKRARVDSAATKEQQSAAKRSCSDPLPDSGPRSERSRSKPISILRLRLKSSEHQRIPWPQKPPPDEQESKFNRQMIVCDGCNRNFHYGCGGIVEDDPRLDDDSVYTCPYCEAGDQSSDEDTDARGTKCCRPDCVVELDEYVVERIIGHRVLPDDAGDEYLIKWQDYDVTESTWEKPDDLFDAKRLVSQFINDALNEDLDLYSPVILLWEAASTDQFR